MRFAARRNSGGCVRTSRSSVSASCTSGWLTRWTGTGRLVYRGPDQPSRFALHGTIPKMKKLAVGVLLLVSVARLPAQTPREVSLLITNGIVVTVDGASRVI